MSAKKCPNLPPLAASRPDYLGGRGSTLLVRVEDVVLRLHRRMARVSAVRGAIGIGRELVRCGFVVEHRVSPPTAFRKSLAVLFHEERLGKDIWHIHHEGCLRALLRLPLEFRDHGALRERLAVSRNAGLVRFDHGRVSDDDLEHFVGPGRRDTDQSSYPLKSENAIPLGDLSEYSSCAETAVAMSTASTATTVATMVTVEIRSTAARVSIFCS